jgi:thymidine kinase
MSRVTVISGPMFAGKSGTIIQRARMQNAVIMIKYSKDTRYIDGSNNSVVSHDGATYPARPVDVLAHVTNDDLKDFQYVCIDEGQFFPDLIEFVERVRTIDHITGLDIAGLDLNHKREDFGSMGKVVALCDQHIALQAVCVDCGGPAIYTRMNSTSQELRDAAASSGVVGGSELYTPVCHQCY